MTPLEIIGIVVVLAIIALVATQSGKGKAGDIDIPEAPQRGGVLFGYFGCKGEQVAETRGHVNLHWECWWDGLEKGIDNTRVASMYTVVDLDAEVLTDSAAMQQWRRKQAGLPPLDKTEPRTVRADGDQWLRALFMRLKSEGVLHQVKAFVPCDEPNLPKAAAIHLMPEAVALIRRIAKEFHELAGVKVGCVYYSDLPMDHIEIFDVVGFNDYEASSGIFAPGALYERMKARLRPDQQTWIIPGATYGQDPKPFVNFANGNPEVLAIVPFLWRDPHDNPQFDGIHNMPETRLKYEAAGRQITGRS